MDNQDRQAIEGLFARLGEVERHGEGFTKECSREGIDIPQRLQGLRNAYNGRMRQLEPELTAPHNGERRSLRSLSASKEAKGMGLKWVLAALLAGSSVGPLRPAGATDAQFTRALKDGGCFPARVSVVQDEEPIKLYNVVCVGSPPRTVAVFCANEACSISPGNDEGS